MPRILELLARITELTDAERQELSTLLADLNVYTDDELAELNTAVDAALTVLEGEPATEENVALVSELADAAVAARSTSEERASAAAEREAQRAAQIARARGQEPDPADNTDNGDGAEGDNPEAADAAADGDGEPAEQPPAESGEQQPTEAAAPVAEATPVAASARPAPAPTRARDLANRRPQPGPTRPAVERLVPTLVAGGDIPGLTAGAQLRDRAAIGRAMSERVKSLRRSPVTGEKALVASARWDYGPGRTLTRDAERNAAIIERAVGDAALVAAGGVCQSPNIDYGQINLSTVSRPVWDTALVRFGADRGGIRWTPSPTLADLAGAVSQWTMQMDRDAATAGLPDPTKPCLRITCGDDDEVELYAVVFCLTIGNMMARANPEIVANRTELARAAHARLGESLLLTSIKADSTAVTTARLLGATRDLLAQFDAAIAGLKDRERMPDGGRVRVVMPRWARELMRADLARQLATGMDAFAVPTSAINEWFDARDANVTWALDAASNSPDQSFDLQAAGPLDPFPAEVEWFVYPEGTHGGLDGAELDLGVVRDSTLNTTNDFTVFSETFEGTFKRGNQSYVVRSAVCPDGTSAATKVSTGLCA